MKKIRFIAVIVAIASLLASCEEDKDNTPEFSSITLSTDAQLDNIIEGSDPIVFTVKSNTGEDITKKCSFFAGEEAMTNNVFNPRLEKMHKIKAVYKGLESNEIIVYVLEDPNKIKFKQHALIEDYTGTWCGWCPRVMYAIEKLHEKTDAAVVIAVHASDALAKKSLYDVLKKKFKIKGLPSAIINRKIKWKTPEHNNISQVTKLVNKQSLLGIAINSKIENDKLVANVSVKFSSTYDDLKLVVVLLEDGCKEDQANYTSFFGGGEVIRGCLHNHVLRESLTSIMGDAIPKEESVYGKVYKKDFNIKIPSNISNKDNINVVAFLVKSDKSVVNARSCNINEKQQFEEL